MPRKIAEKVSSFHSELDAYYREALVATRESEERGKLRHLELHPSSFPYCGLRHMNAVCEAPPGSVRTQDFRMSVTVDVGTTFHSVIQQAMGSLGQIYGDWHCKCGNRTSFSRLSLCKKCGRTMTYEELGVRIGKRICGHTDGLFRIKGTAKYVLVDYKTTRSSKVLDHKRGKYKAFPDKTNVAQITKYCGLLSLQYEVDIVGWALIYGGRDSLATDYVIISANVSKDDLEDIQHDLAVWDDHFDHVVKSSTLADVKVLVDEKPCKSHEYYMDNYHDKYNPCALAGICFNRKVLKEHMEERIERAQEWLPLTRISLSKAHRELEAKTGIKYKS